MNNARRKEITALVDRLNELLAEVEAITEAENEYLDNMPDSFKYGKKGDKAQAAIENLEYAASSITEAVEYLEGAAE